MTWPMYSAQCRKAVNDLLKQGGSLSAYRANPSFGVEPVKDSWAWRFEREVEKRFNVRHCVAVNSGTAALHGALVGLRLKEGDEVITSPYTFSATAATILLSGGRPVFADVDPYTFSINAGTVKRVLTKRTRAILPVHLFGGFQDLTEMRSLGLPIIEDACQAVGARRGDTYSGTAGTAGAYSFNGTKNVPAGEAGALVTNDSQLAEKARLFMNHGENFNGPIGVNYRMNELTACVAYHGLLELEERNQRRIDLAKRLVVELGDFEGHYTPFNTDGSHVFYVTPITPRMDRKAFIQRMARRGVTVGAGYIQPTLDRYPAFRKFARGPLPVVEELSRKTLCILSTLTPDRPLSYAAEVAKAMRESLE